MPYQGGHHAHASRSKGKSSSLFFVRNCRYSCTVSSWDVEEYGGQEHDVNLAAITAACLVLRYRLLRSTLNEVMPLLGAPSLHVAAELVFCASNRSGCATTTAVMSIFSASQVKVQAREEVGLGGRGAGEGKGRERGWRSGAADMDMAVSPEREVGAGGRERGPSRSQARGYR